LLVLIGPWYKKISGGCALSFQEPPVLVNKGDLEWPM
jgi:hypothetical protein